MAAFSSCLIVDRDRKRAADDVQTALISTHVDGAIDLPGEAGSALVSGKTRGQGIVAGVDGRTGRGDSPAQREQGMGLGRTAVIGQRAQQRIHADDIAVHAVGSITRIASGVLNE